MLDPSRIARGHDQSLAPFVRERTTTDERGVCTASLCRTRRGGRPEPTPSHQVQTAPWRSSGPGFRTSWGWPA